jgi:hypothetical protein
LVLAVGLYFVNPLVGLAMFPALVVMGMIRSRRGEREVRAQLGPSCLWPDYAISYIEWHGTIESFEVGSDAYAAKFLLANATKLVNVTPAHRRLMSEAQAAIVARITVEASDRPPLALPPPAAKVNDDEELHRWVAKLESLKGPAARRTLLQSALAAVGSEGARQRLLLEASKIDVQAALDKADGLKTVGAKRRTLQAALDAIRADEIADELQAEQIRWLEDALAELSNGEK